jgi:alkylation response protein AidB-like acyl-CoA dehydrogenase
VTVPDRSSAVDGVLQSAESFFFKEVRPSANRIDQELEALVAALDRMAELGLLGLRVPAKHGGHGVEDKSFRRFQEASARASGALAFLQTQHQSACGFIASSPNVEAQQRFLPSMASGDVRMGIAFSQLRRPGPPMMTATKVDGGYVFDGVAPWITGWGIFGWCVFAGTLPSGESAWGVGELTPSPSLKPSSVMRLAALEVAQTISANLESYFVPDEAIIHIRPPDWIHSNDSLNLALQSPFALGCAQAGIDIVLEAHKTKPLGGIIDAASALQAELDECRTEAYAAMDDKGNLERSLRARAWAIELAGRCSHAAVVASSGKGNSMSSDAQRVYREALVFSVSAQTPAILEATLARLAKK